MKHSVFTHEFVEAIPSELDHGRLYVSIRYRTATHLCACGCGTKVVTPIKPAKWHILYDGDAVSLWPSIGRWQAPCHSHYWIRANRVVWSDPWTEDEIAAGRKRDAHDLRRYYSDRQPAAEQIMEPAPSQKPGILTRLRLWMMRIRRR